MAVHLNARLNTRFIPMLFTGAALLAAASISSRASQESEHEGMVDRKPGFSTIAYAPDRADSGTSDIASQLPTSSNAEGPAPMDASPSHSASE